MEEVNLEEGLTAFRCPETHGHYISLQAYWSWLQKQPQRLEHLPVRDSSDQEVVETSEAKICPESGTIMLRYKVGKGFDFTIDRSSTGGVWFDAGEWEALRERNFHDEVHLIFTAPWQQSVRDEKSASVRQEILTERLGEELYNELVVLRDRLNKSEHKELALAFLHDVE